MDFLVTCNSRNLRCSTGSVSCIVSKVSKRRITPEPFDKKKAPITLVIRLVREVELLEKTWDPVNAQCLWHAHVLKLPFEQALRR